MIWFGIAVYILMILIFLWWLTAATSEKAYPARVADDPWPTQVEAADQVREELCASSDPEDEHLPNVYIHCDYNPDEIKRFYEIPDALVEAIRPAESRLTFAECLALMVDTKKVDDK